MKVNPWSLARPTWTPQRKTFTDPAHPGVEFTLTVRPLDGCELMLAVEQAEQQIEMWVKGKDGQPPLDYPLGGSVRLSEGLLRSVALIEAQQRQLDRTPLDPENFYDANDLIGIAYNAPAAWNGLAAWAQKYLNLSESAAGNAAGADGAS